MDLNKLERILNDINYAEVRRRKFEDVYIRFYHEASILQEPGLGISFKDMC